MRQAAARHALARLIVLDCAEPGPRLDTLVGLIEPAHQANVPLFEQVQATGRLPALDADGFFLSLLFLGALPFALQDFAQTWAGDNLRTKAGAERHVQRTLRTRFGPVD